MTTDTRKIPETPTDAQVLDVCMSYRHDYGLLSEKSKESVAYQIRQIWAAVWKACEEEQTQ